MLQKFLYHKKINALLISYKENIGYLSNFWGSFAYLLVTPRSTKLFTDGRYLAEAKKHVFKEIKVFDYKQLKTQLKGKKVGFEADKITVSELKRLKKKFPETSFRMTQNLIENLRITKKADEIVKIKKAAQINDKILGDLKSFIQIGMTEREVQWKIRELAFLYGGEEMSFKSIVNFGKHTAHPHHAPDYTKLKKGDLILIDMGIRYKNYCSDITRVFFTKAPTKKQKEIFEIVLNAQNKGIQEVCKTKDCSMIDRAAREFIENEGFGDFFTHSLGHGVGLEIHEFPTLSIYSKDLLEENAVFTIEPGIYLPNKFGIRLEDLFVYQEKKAIRLSKFTKKIDELVLSF